MRSLILRACTRGLSPGPADVDNVPRGALRELGPMRLCMLRAPPTPRIVLGLRDVLTIRKPYAGNGASPTATRPLRDYYDEIWIYGDPLVFDAQHDYWFRRTCSQNPLHGLFRPVRAHALRAGRRLLAAEQLCLRDQDTVLCLPRRREDSATVLAVRSRHRPADGFNALIVPGPYLRRSRCASLNSAPRPIRGFA